ncbi:MAG: hypothetical protein ACXU8U_06250 [Asticcacaulis sp.]
MSLCPRTPQRRRAAAIAAICAGSSSATIAISHRHSGGGHSGDWQDAGMAIAIGLIVAALVILIVAGLRRR